MQLASSGELLSRGWKGFKENLQVFIAVGLIGMVLGFIQNAAGRESNIVGPFDELWRMVSSVAAQIAQVGLTLAVTRMTLKIQAGERIVYDDLTAGLKDFFPFLLAYLLFGLAVAGGTVLLIVPGIIFAIWFGFFGYVILDQHVDPVEALRRSKRLTEGVRGALFVKGLVFAGVNLLGAIALGIGLFVTIPMTAIALAHLYRQLVERAAHLPSSTTLTAPPTTPIQAF